MAGINSKKAANKQVVTLNATAKRTLLVSQMHKLVYKQNQTLLLAEPYYTAVTGMQVLKGAILLDGDLTCPRIQLSNTHAAVVHTIRALAKDQFEARANVVPAN